MAEREDMEQEPPISKWQEIILRSQSGDTDATLKLLTQFRSLLLYEARQYVNQSLQIEPEDALSTMILLFLEFIRSFHKKEISDKKIPGLFKKYLHDKRLDLQASRKRHCPDSYAVDYEAEIARNSVFAQRRIGALQIYLSVCYQIFHYLSQIETHPRLYAETNVHGYAVEGVGNQGLAVVLQRIRCVNKLHVDKPVMVCTFRLLVDDGVEQLVIYGTKSPTNCDAHLA